MAEHGANGIGTKAWPVVGLAITLITSIITVSFWMGSLSTTLSELKEREDKQAAVDREAVIAAELRNQQKIADAKVLAEKAVAEAKVLADKNVAQVREIYEQGMKTMSNQMAISNQVMQGVDDKNTEAHGKIFKELGDLKTAIARIETLLKVPSSGANGAQTRGYVRP